ncbi:hypothetical protein FQN49_007370, partial [Arthroderma sp. PD_2]
MSGRRLLDAITFLNASRHVAKKHIVLQRHALDHHARTSSLTKEAKNQVQRISIAVQAASDLARKLDEDPTPTSAPTNRDHDGGEDTNGSKDEIKLDDSFEKNDIIIEATRTQPVDGAEVGTKSATGEASSSDTAGKDAANEKDEVPEEMMQQLFRSRK